jgi:hypothetical protein
MRKTRPGWTVILLYPDYATGDFGADIYVERSSCRDPYKAVAMVQKKAWEGRGGELGAINKPEDMRPIAVFKGRHILRLDATNFEEVKP